MTPQSRAIPVLLTRPAAQADRFAAEMAERFGAALRPVASPLMAPVFLQPDLPVEPCAAVILTSETGVEAALRLRRAGAALPDRALCVGDRTAAAARAAGFDAISAAGDAEALIALILGDGKTRGADAPLVHLRGREARGDIAPRLTAAGVPTRSAIVYAQEEVALSEEARALLDGGAPVLMPIFSPRSAQLLAGQGPFAAPLWIASMSPAVARAAMGLTPERHVTAARPESGAMLDAIGALIADPCA